MYNQRILEKIKAEEGFELKAYLCTAGYWTIGTGHNLESPMSDKIYDIFDENQRYLIMTRDFKNLEITEEQAEKILIEDLKVVSSDYETIFGYYNVNEDAELVMYDMLFQLGYPRFKKFSKTIQYIKEQDYDSASIEILVGSNPNDPSKYFKDTPHRALRNSEILASIDDLTIDTQTLINQAIEQAESEMVIK